jgi:hypothetical protein
VTLNLAYALCSLGLAFGITAFTTFSVRTESHPSLFVSSFVVSVLAIDALMWANRIPYDMATLLTGVGVVIGAAFTVGIRIARWAERRWGVS